MKALLVHPVARESMWNLKEAAHVMGARATSAPLGLLTVAAMLPSTWTLRVVDLNVRALADEELAWADIVLVSAMVCHRESAHAVLARARDAGKPIVAGGPLFTSHPDLYADVDHLVLDEAEVTLAPFLDDLAAGRPGHLYRSPLKPDLSLTPLPRWDLLDLRDYVWMNVQFSRGCPFGCDFCDVIRLYGRAWRTKPVEQMVAELDALYARRWRGYVFMADDNFVAVPEKTSALLTALAAWQRGRGYPFVFATQVSVRLADDERLLRLMGEAGFEYVAVGIETPIDASLEEAHKTQNRASDLLEAVRTIQRHGIVVIGNFIVGFDNDPPDVCERHADFIQRAAVVLAHPGILQAYRGTPLYERLAVEGRLAGESAGDPNLGTTNVVTKIETRELRERYWRMLVRLYSAERFYDRVRGLFVACRIERSTRINPRWLKGVILGILRVGFFDAPRASWRFWTTLAAVARVNRRAWPKVVASAIFGYHMRRWVARQARGAW